MLHPYVVMVFAKMRREAMAQGMKVDGLDDVRQASRLSLDKRGHRMHNLSTAGPVPQSSLITKS